MSESTRDGRGFHKEAATPKKSRPHGRQPYFRLPGAAVFALALIALCGASQVAHAQLSTNYVFVGAQQIGTGYVAVYTATPQFGGGTVTDTGPAYSYNMQGSFIDPTVWGGSGGLQDDQQVPPGEPSTFETAPPGANDSIFVVGEPAGDKTEGGVHPTINVATNSSNEALTDSVLYGVAGEGAPGSLGYTGGAGFILTNVTGTVANLSVTGPGTMTLAGLNVSGVTAIDSIGGIGLVENTAGPIVFAGTHDSYITTVSSYAPSALTVNGGSLTTPFLTLAAGTDLAPNYSTAYPSSPPDFTFTQTGAPDPVADAGSLTISGATLTGTITQITGVPSSTVNYVPAGYVAPGDYNTTTTTTGIDPNTFQSYSTEHISVAPVILTNGATLNATTELDIIGVDPILYPNATGTTTLAADASTITGGNIVIATGATGLGSGNEDASAELFLADGSTLTATNGTLYVGDTGDATLDVSDGSMITDEQAIIGNETGSIGVATIDDSTWTNNGYLAVGNNGIGGLNIQAGGEVMTTGEYGNIYIAGLAGSSLSEVTVTGDGSLLQSSGYFTIASDGTDDGSATLTVEDGAEVITGDVMNVGEVADSTGTVAVSSGATVTTNTTGTYGPNSTVLGVVADSTGILNIDGDGSQFESMGDMQIGYGGDGGVTITDGGALVVDGTLFRIAHDATSGGILTVTGAGSSVTADNATFYIGSGGDGTAMIEEGATLTVMATDIGTESTGVGELDIDGSGTTASLGDVTVGDAGVGTLNVMNAASVTTSDFTVGAQAGPDNAQSMVEIGTNAQVMVEGNMVIGDAGQGSVLVYDQGMLSVEELTVGKSDGGNGDLSVTSNTTVTTSGKVIIGDEQGSEGTVEVQGTGAMLTIDDDLTVGNDGTGALAVTGGAYVSNQDATVGAEGDSIGVALVDGTGSTWNSTGMLTIGDQGVGEVTVQNGGTLQVAGDLTIGKQDGSEGTLTVDGDSTTFTYTGGDVTVGASGTGTMNVQNGAFVDLSGTSVTLGDEDDGSDATGEGTLNVTDPDTILNTGDLTVGGKGTGMLSVMNGAMLSSGDGSIGDEDGSSGVATVSGDGSSWTATGMTVGGDGSGTLNIEDGGEVTVNSTELVIGDEESGNGTVTLSDAGSQLNFTGELQVGENGTGLFAVQGGASFTGHAVVVGDMPGSNGTLNVDGSGTTMEVQTDFNIGEQGGGTLNVTNGAELLSDGDATLADMGGSSATAKVDGSSSWGVAGNLTVGGQAGAMLTVSAGSTVSSRDLTIGDQLTGNGTVDVTGTAADTPSTVQYENTLVVGNNGEGNLNLTKGGEVAPTGTGTGEATVAAQSGSIGGVSVDGTGSDFKATSLSVGGSSTKAGGTGTFTLTNGGTAEVATSVTTGSEGSINATGGAFTIGSNSEQATTGEILVNSGGSLGGSGQVTGNVVVNGGTVAPGDPVTLTLNGNYTEQTGSLLQLQIGGTASSDYDHLIVNGTVSLDVGAKLELDFTDGFAPKTGETFDLIEDEATDPDNDSFAKVDVDITGLDPGFDYSITSENNMFVLTALNDAEAVPEPSTWALMLGGLGLLLFWRVRRRTKDINSVSSCLSP